MEKEDINYLTLSENLEKLIDKAKGKERKELRAKHMDFLTKVQELLEIETGKDTQKYITAMDNLEKTNKEIRSAIKDVNRISQVLTSITNTMNVIGEIKEIV